MKTIDQNNATTNLSEILTDSRGELEHTRNEMDYFLDVLKDLKTMTIGDSMKSLKVARLVQELHHFQRMNKKLSTENETINNMLTTDSSTNRQKTLIEYKSEITDFLSGYKEFKYNFRAFVSDMDHVNSRAL